MRYDFLLEPVADDAPCGPDLEAEGDDAFLDYYYDALARFPERFVDTTTGEIFDRKSIDLKSEVEKIGALLARSRDLRLLVVEAQFQILGGQLAGFADCLTAIARLLQERWDDVHPRVGGDPTDRRNTIELLDSRASVVLPLEFAPLLRDKRSQNIVWRDYAVGSGKRPLLGIGVEVQECFFHCAKAFKRSGLWQPETWSSRAGMASLAQILVDQIKPENTSVEELEKQIAESYATRLY